jgi:hypothetical protein
VSKVSLEPQIRLLYWVSCAGSEHCNYNNKPYGIEALLQDPSPSANCVPESYIAVVVEFDGIVRQTVGNFRQVSYKRVFVSSIAFTNLMYVNCAQILQEGNFRMKVMHEERSVEKRGSCCTAANRRLGYLSVIKLAKYNRLIQKKYRVERAYHGHSRLKAA